MEKFTTRFWIFCGEAIDDRNQESLPKSSERRWLARARGSLVAAGHEKRRSEDRRVDEGSCAQRCSASMVCARSEKVAGVSKEIPHRIKAEKRITRRVKGNRKGTQNIDASFWRER